MATNRNIVETRKLNKKNKARLGRGGDTKIREVDNRASHVNALEAYLIDVNGKAGEEYAKRVGAGTVNPLTGMPEYHPLTGYDSHTHNNDGSITTQTKSQYGGYTTSTSPPPVDDVVSPVETTTPKPTTDFTNIGDTMYADIVKRDKERIEAQANFDYSYENLSNVTGEQLQTFDPNLGDEDVMYFQDIFTDKPFDFFREQQELITGEIDPKTGLPIDPTTGRAGETRGFTERGLQSTYGATMGALGSQEAALGRTTGRGLRGAGMGRDIAASRSGLATSGTITQTYETQKKDLFQDYSAGMKDIGRQRGTALDTLTLGQDVAAADYKHTVDVAGLDLRTGTYSEEQRQLDEYWDMIGMRQRAG